MVSPTSSRAGIPDVYDRHGRLGDGFAGALGLHVLVVAALLAGTYLLHDKPEHWGERQASVGAIQASMVSALPLPSHADPH